MSDSMELQSISNVIESTLCTLKFQSEEPFTDKTATRLIELFWDKYHFKDSELSFDNEKLKITFNKMLRLYEQDFSETPNEQLIKVLAAVYRSIQRRTNGGIEYLQFAQQYVGLRVENGVRTLTSDHFDESLWEKAYH